MDPLGIALIEKPPKRRVRFHVGAEDLCRRLLFDSISVGSILKVIRKAAVLSSSEILQLLILRSPEGIPFADNKNRANHSTVRCHAYFSSARDFVADPCRDGLAPGLSQS